MTLLSRDGPYVKDGPGGEYAMHHSLRVCYASLFESCEKRRKREPGIVEGGNARIQEVLVFGLLKGDKLND